MADKKHLKVVDDRDAVVTDSRVAALRQIGERVTAGQWHTPEATALFESMKKLEKPEFNLNLMERELGLPGVADAFLAWEREGL